MSELKKVTVVICGKSFSISTDEKEECIYKAASMVDSLVRDLAEKTQLNNDNPKIAMLVALQFAIDFLKNGEQLSLFQRKAESLTQRLNSEI